MLAAGEAIAQRPRGTIPSLLAQVEPVAVAEQHRLAQSVCPLDRERRQCRAPHPNTLFLE